MSLTLLCEPAAGSCLRQGEKAAAGMVREEVPWQARAAQGGKRDCLWLRGLLVRVHVQAGAVQAGSATAARDHGQAEGRTTCAGQV